MLRVAVSWLNVFEFAFLKVDLYKLRGNSGEIDLQLSLNLIATLVLDCLGLVASFSWSVQCWIKAPTFATDYTDG